jgi:serine phosphatase RsbU (regulator of sigma subunit)
MVQKASNRRRSALDAGRLESLLRVPKALATEFELDRVLQVIVEQASEVLEAERSSLFLRDDETGDLDGIVLQGVTTGRIRLPPGKGLAGSVAQTGSTINVADAYADPRFSPAYDAQTGFRTRAVLTMPIHGPTGRLLGVLQVLNRKRGGAFGPADEALLEAFASHAALALERARLIEARIERERMKEGLRVARDIQLGMLQADFRSDSDRVEIASRMISAESVGGDLYELFHVDEHRLGFAVGDVSGKGLPAALYMAGTLALLRSAGHDALTPAAACRRIHRAQSNTKAMFVTLFYGILDLRTGRVRYCNAGHPPPCLVRPGRVSFRRRAENLPLGLLKNPAYRSGSFRMKPGDTLLLYTDGVLEAMNSEGEQFESERLLESLDTGESKSPAATVDAVLHAVRAFAGPSGPRDDLTLLALRYR